MERRQNRQVADVSDYTGFRKQRIGGAAATADPAAVHETPAVETVTTAGRILVVGARA